MICSKIVKGTSCYQMQEENMQYNHSFLLFEFFSSARWEITV